MEFLLYHSEISRGSMEWNPNTPGEKTNPGLFSNYNCIENSIKRMIEGKK
ncbi:protein of unknown function [Vibrio tapetis subsp. tapetis]|uniref:Uncharacterized protein n=1 Tax=Vibrio tapetis subsp. tapetis TaxID=1671868 RepID=A0A2N8ZHX0_9VIBR|nr:protein of unknown function [Vibrio tapetis subsp. tapetis]